MKSDEEYKAQVLIVDDEPYIIKSLLRQLRQEGYKLLSAETGGQALSILDQTLIDVILLDIKLPDLNGLDVLRRAKQIDPETVVVIKTGHGTISTAVKAMKEGAFEFLTKPFEGNDLIPITLDRAVKYKMLLKENRQMQGMLSGQLQFSNMVGSSAPMQRIFKLIERLAKIDSTILITGKSGTGKEVFARAIHFNSNRKQHPFVPVDCGAIPPGVIESELFGHLKGSYTGASQSTSGLIRMAHKGTVFFDEIGELPLNMQTKLLRFLQEKEVRPIGEATAYPVDVRIIVATNQDLVQMVSEKRFREDLYYRINVVNIEIPPLRERKEDIPVLIKFFMDKYSPRLNRGITISPEAFEQLLNYSWPGNIRELENIIVSILSLSSGEVIKLEHLPPLLRSFTPCIPEQIPNDIPLSLEAYERLAIERALIHSSGNPIKAAKLLNIGTSTIYRRIKKLNIDVKSLSSRPFP